MRQKLKMSKIIIGIEKEAGTWHSLIEKWCEIWYSAHLATSRKSWYKQCWSVNCPPSPRREVSVQLSRDWHLWCGWNRRCQQWLPWPGMSPGHRGWRQSSHTSLSPAPRAMMAHGTGLRAARLPTLECSKHPLNSWGCSDAVQTQK